MDKPMQALAQLIWGLTFGVFFFKCVSKFMNAHIFLTQKGYKRRDIFFFVNIPLHTPANQKSADVWRCLDQMGKLPSLSPRRWWPQHSCPSPESAVVLSTTRGQQFDPSITGWWGSVSICSRSLVKGAESPHWVSSVCGGKGPAVWMF